MHHNLPAQLVEQADMEKLQVKLVHGTLTNSRNTSPQRNPNHNSTTINLSHRRSSSIQQQHHNNNSTTIFTTSIDGGMPHHQHLARPPAAAVPTSTPVDAATTTPQERMATYILNHKQTYRDDIETYLAYNERVKRGLALLQNSNDVKDGKRTLELDDMAHQLHLSVADKLTRAETLLERFRRSTSGALTELISQSKAYQSRSSNDDDDTTASRFPDVPGHLEKFILEAHERHREDRAKIKAKASSLRGAAGAATFALSLRGGVHESKGGKPRNSSAVTLAHQDADDESAYSQGSASFSFGHSSPTAKGDRRMTNYSFDDSVSATSCMTASILSPQYSGADASAQQRQEWFDTIADHVGQPSSHHLVVPEVVHEIAPVSASELERRIDLLTVDVGLTVPVKVAAQQPVSMAVSANAPSATKVPESIASTAAVFRSPSFASGDHHAPPLLGNKREEDRAVELPNVLETSDRLASPDTLQSSGIIIARGASEMNARSVVDDHSMLNSTALQQVDKRSSIISVATSPISGGDLQKRGSIAYTEASRRRGSSSPSADVVVATSVMVPHSALQMIEGSSSARAADEGSVRQQQYTTTSTVVTTHRASVAIPPTARWGNSCNCESMFHLMKAKMFEDVKRAVKARYVCGFMNQMEAMANEVMDWKQSMTEELERLADVLTALLHERKEAEREVAEVSAALDSIKRSLMIDGSSSAGGGASAELMLEQVQETIALQQKQHQQLVQQQQEFIASGAFVATPGAGTPQIVGTPRPEDHTPSRSTSPAAKYVALLRSDAAGASSPASPVISTHGGGFSPDAASRRWPTVVDVDDSVVEHNPPPKRSHENSEAPRTSSLSTTPPPEAPPLAALEGGGGTSQHLQRTRSIVGSVRVDWDRFLQDHSPVGKRVERLLTANRFLEESLMHMHDHFIPPPPPVTATGAAAASHWLSNSQKRRTSLGGGEGDDSDNDTSKAASYNTSTAASPRAAAAPVAKLRLVSTRMADATTQTIEELDYFLDNIENVMTGGSQHNPQMALHMQATAQYGSAAANSMMQAAMSGSGSASLGAPVSPLLNRKEPAILQPADDAVSKTATLRMQQMLSTLSLPPQIASLVPKQATPTLASLSNDDADEIEKVDPSRLSTTIASAFHEILTSIQAFSKDVISSRVKRLPAALRSVPAADVNLSVDEFDDTLRLKLRLIVSRVNEAFLGCSSAVESVTDLVTKVQSQKDALTKSEALVAELQRATTNSKSFNKERDDTVKALEAKVAKLTAAALQQSVKKVAAEKSSPMQSKEGQLGRANRNLEETRNVLAGLVERVKETLLRCCDSGKNVSLACGLKDMWSSHRFAPSDSSPPAASGAVSPTSHENGRTWLTEVNALEETLLQMNTPEFGCYLHARAYPDPGLLDLCHTAAKSSEMVMNIIRMNKFDVPLPAMEFIGKALTMFAAQGPNETEEDFLAQRERAIARHEPEPIAAYRQLRDTTAADLFSSVTKQLHLMGTMVQTLRTELPKQRKELIKPFVNAARTVLEIGREDLKSTLFAMEWYLKKRQNEKALLQGMDRAQEILDDAEEHLNEMMEQQTEPKEDDNDDAKDVAEANGPQAEKSDALSPPQPHQLEASVSFISQSATVNFSESRNQMSPKNSSRKKKLQRNASALSLSQSQASHDEEADNPLKALFLHIQNYRSHSDEILHLLSDKKLSTVSDTSVISDALSEFTSSHHVPMTARLRRNLKDVMARMMSIIEGKNIAQTLSRDASEGTEVLEWVDEMCQTGDITFRDQGTDYVVDDFEPYEGDPTMIQELFEQFEEQIHSKLDVEDRVFSGEGEDYAGVASSPLLVDAEHHDGEQQQQQQQGSPADGGGHVSPQRGHLPLSSPSGATDDLLHSPSKRNSKKKTCANVYVQTAVDTDTMATLYQRVPLPQLFLCRTSLMHALDTLADSIGATAANPNNSFDVNPQEEIQRMRNSAVAMEGLHSYRRGNSNRELGLQWISLMDQTLLLIGNELQSKLQTIQTLFSVSQFSASPTKKKPPTGKKVQTVDAAVLASRPTSNASVQVRGNTSSSGGHSGGGGGGFVDNLADEELGRHSFVSVCTTFQGSWDYLKRMSEYQKHLIVAAARHQGATTTSPTSQPLLRLTDGGAALGTPLEQPAMTESIRLDINSKQQVPRRPSRNGSITTIFEPQQQGGILTASFASAGGGSSRDTPRTPAGVAAVIADLQTAMGGRPTSVGSTEHLTPSDGLGPLLAPFAKDPLTQLPIATAASSMLSLDKNIALPLRRAVYRWLNEPPFAVAPGEHETATHPPFSSCTASLRREVAALQAITKCLERYMELTGSYGQSLLRLVGKRIRRRVWEKQRDTIEAAGLRTIELHSKQYKFLKAGSGMNARARREEQARQLFDRSARWKALLQQRTTALHREASRMEHVLMSLSTQREEVLLDFMRQYYGMQQQGGGLSAFGRDTPLQRGARQRSSRHPQQHVTLLPAEARAAVLHQKEPIQGLITILWTGRAHGVNGPDDDPRSKSWFDRTGTSQGGARTSLRLDDLARQKRGGNMSPGDDPVDPSQIASRQHLVVSADDLERIFKKDYLNWSQSTAGVRTMLSTHNMYAVKKSSSSKQSPLQHLAAGGAAATGASSTHTSGPRTLRPLSELEDLSSGGVTVTGWKGGLIHLDAGVPLPDVGRSPTSTTTAPLPTAAATADVPPPLAMRPGAVTQPSSPVPSPQPLFSATSLLPPRTTTPPQLRSQVAQLNPLRAMITIRQHQQQQQQNSDSIKVSDGVSSTSKQIVERPQHTLAASKNGVHGRATNVGSVLKLNRLGPAQSTLTRGTGATAGGGGGGSSSASFVLGGDVEGSYLLGVDVSTRQQPPRKPGAGILLAPMPLDVDQLKQEVDDRDHFD
ncbi:Hypothetical protein, putative [Bodo saltans]|uniref:Uncharacterized protein n=1 Tax=Bodo saltans TaxID=75058 RepID=A0A0S4JQW8_BODSA|nr:Hypothetical protein, putative [Bodo saltans]|eukprot:CUG92943.1 Hypothetical protein, putative [Bodo saltans]